MFLEPRLDDGDLIASTKIVRQFALAWLVFFGAMGVLSLYREGHGNPAGLWLLAVATIGGLVGILRPAWMRPLFQVSLMMTFPIGKVVTVLVCALSFFGVFSPVSLFFRVIGRDRLRIRTGRKTESYWVDCPDPKNLESYFYQS